MTGTMPHTLTEPTFTPATTRPLLIAACERLGLDPTGATVLRHHSNAVYLLAQAPVVVKISHPDNTHTRSTVDLLHWLELHRVPSITMATTADQPLEIAGCDVTAWTYLPQTRAITADEIAGPLAALHRTPTPPGTRRLDPFTSINRSIAQSACLNTDEKALLRERSDQLARGWASLELDAHATLLHGDPQHRNTLWDETANRAVLCDWESAVVGPLEWDLVTIEIHCRRFAHPQAEYDAFCERYGRDVREWSGYEITRDIRELRMIASNARKSSPGTAPADEVHRRIAHLHSGTTLRWHIL
ncbi:MAG: phosphotransferase family protein [Pseudonocardiaceae bacterium]|uniref:phosphotransferase family protein n=1 Tax=Nocardioides sp. NBC_00368 TaxID=2976000 RepID=UPI002E2484DF